MAAPPIIGRHPILLLAAREVSAGRHALWQLHELDGLILAGGGDWAGAAAALEQANQQDPRVLLTLSRALAGSGHAEAAHAACRRVVEFNQLNLNYGLVRPAALAMCGS